MEVSAEAKRVMVQALSKLYSSRCQRGGVRLHRSLLLTLVMKSARDIYHSARASCDNQETWEKPENQEKQRSMAEQEKVPVSSSNSPTEESMDTSSPEVPPETPNSTPSESTQAELDQENLSPVRADRQSRKRRGKTTTEPDFLPCKRAKMESGEVLRILQDATLRSNVNSVNCARETDSLPVAHTLRTVATC